MSYPSGYDHGWFDNAITVNILNRLLILLSVFLIACTPEDPIPVEDPIVPAVVIVEEEIVVVPEVIITPPEPPEEVTEVVVVVEVEPDYKVKGREQLAGIKTKFTKPRYSRTYKVKYDLYFYKYTKMYLPLHDPAMVKSLCMAESNLNPLAESGVGAKGLCQHMDATWKENMGNLGLSGNVFDPELNVQATAYYLGKMRRMWKAPRSEEDRMFLAKASYNAGAGHLIKAQRICGGPAEYEEIAICLHVVTGHHSVETLTYVERNHMFYRELIWNGL